MLFISFIASPYGVLMFNCEYLGLIQIFVVFLESVIMSGYSFIDLLIKRLHSSTVVALDN
jgi:hypothetical protein